LSNENAVIELLAFHNLKSMLPV